MKKIRIAGLLLVPIALLCGCSSTSTLSFSANWYKSTDIKTVNDTYEYLEYSVTGSDYSSTDNITVEYDEGTYTTELKNETLTLADGTTQGGYVYTTNLSISGRYTVNGETGETFQDSVVSVVRFLSVSNKLQPVSSEKTVVSTTPLSYAVSESASVSDAVTTYNFTYKVEYDELLTKATATYTDNASESESTVTEYDIEDDSTYLDNEQILFALRGVDLSSSQTFRSINMSQGKVMEISASGTATEESVSFTMDNTAVDATITAYSTTIGYTATVAGQVQTAIYAATVDSSSNTYRNVLLSLQSPTIYSLATLTYTLKTATFTTK